MQVQPDVSSGLLPDILKTQFCPPSMRTVGRHRTAACCSLLQLMSMRFACLTPCGSLLGCLRGAVKHVSQDNPWLSLLTPHQLVEINSAFKRFGAPPSSLRAHFRSAALARRMRRPCRQLAHPWRGLDR